MGEREHLTLERHQDTALPSDRNYGTYAAAARRPVPSIDNRGGNYAPEFPRLESTEEQEDHSKAQDFAAAPSKTCRICIHAAPSYACVPCGHMCLCERCSGPYGDGTSTECPQCRKEIASLLRLFSDGAGSTCCICLEEPASYAFVPCGHMRLCGGCGGPYKDGRSKKCPQCRTYVSSVLQVY